MGRKTYDRRAGRPRPPGQRSDFTYIAEDLARARRYATRPTPQTTGAEQPPGEQEATPA